MFTRLFLLAALSCACWLPSTVVAQEEASSSIQDDDPASGEKAHKGCMQLCVEDGENPLDCEQYCIITASVDCTTPLRIAQR